MGNCKTQDGKTLKQQSITLQASVIQRIKAMGCPTNQLLIDQRQISNINFKRAILDLPQEIFKEQNQKRQKTTGSLKEENLFLNWADNLSINCERIFYPFKSDNKQITKQNQIQKIQQFVKQAAQRDKKIRGSGMRHSFSNIFVDQNQLIVSLYPSDIAVGSSKDLEQYAEAMINLQRNMEKQSDISEHLCMIRYQKYDQGLKKHLVKIGASVSNEQLRIWCNQNNLQYPSNAIMVQVNFCGALLTCSHGSGINTQTLADYVNEIQFINFKGDRHIVSKKEQPHLIGSAASSLGLLGLVIFVTIQMQRGQIIKTEPRKGYKDDIIPYPKSWLESKQFMKRRQTERKKFKVQDSTKWIEKYNKFKQGINKTYCEWFFFPLEDENCFQNAWIVYGEKSEKMKAELEKSRKRFIENYPPPLVKISSFITLSVNNFLFNNPYNRLAEKSILGTMIMKNPFLYFPKKESYLNYMDGIHFQRGIQNMKVRNFQILINVPVIEREGKKEMDYDLIQRIWWTAFQIVQENKNIVNMALQMRVFGRSSCTIAPQFGYEYTCSIEILRVLTSEKTQTKWYEIVSLIFELWKNIKDSNNNPVTVRPHWAKQWTGISNVKKHLLQDLTMKQNIRKFWEDYKLIAKERNFDAIKNLQTFSNETYRELLINSIPQLKI